MKPCWKVFRHGGWFDAWQMLNLRSVVMTDRYRFGSIHATRTDQPMFFVSSLQVGIDLALTFSGRLLVIKVQAGDELATPQEFYAKSWHEPFILRLGIDCAMDLNTLGHQDPVLLSHGIEIPNPHEIQIPEFAMIEGKTLLLPSRKIEYLNDIRRAWDIVQKEAQEDKR